jgi:hypothetical protein
MAQTLVEQVINEVRTLPEQELGKILDFVISIKRENVRKGTKPPRGRELLEYLKQEGLISEFPSLEEDDEPEFEPIPYKGKPVSETIIENRGTK